MLKNWRNKKPGDKILWTWNDFDGSGSMEAIITECFDDHLIAENGDIHLWVDDDTANCYYEIEKSKDRIESLWDGDTMIYLVYIDGKHTTSHWTMEDAEKSFEEEMHKEK